MNRKIQKYYYAINDILKTSESLLRKVNLIEFSPFEHSFSDSVIMDQNYRFENFIKLKFYAPQNCNDKLRNSFNLMNVHIKNMVSETVEFSKIDIKKLTGVTNSRDKENWIKNNAENLCAASKLFDYLPKSTEQDFINAIAHTKKALFNNTYQVYASKWDNKIFWGNDDGSHHMAIAVYLSKKMNYSYELPCKIHTYSINENICNSILNDFYIFAINEKDEINIFHIFTQYYVPFQISYFINPHHNHLFIFLPKNNNKCQHLVKYFLVLNSSSFLNFNTILENMIFKQQLL